MPLSLALGLCMMTLGLSSVMIAQDDRDTAVLRQDSAASVLVSDSAIAQVLADLTTGSNAMLLNRNYDPINPNTGTTYLGQDGIPNTGDETQDATDEWTNYTAQCLTSQGATQPNVAFMSGSLDQKSQYQLLAYRYDPELQQGYLIIEGRRLTLSTYVYVTLDVTPEVMTFPGVMTQSSMYWQGRTIVGSNGNAFFATSDAATTNLQSSVDVDDISRPTYLNAIWSGSSDGFVNDTIQGKLVACDFSYVSSLVHQGNDLGTITSSQTLVATGPDVTHFQADSIDLSGTDQLIVDTTAGPVYLYLNGVLSLRDSAKIVNSRSDSIAPRVGDLRILSNLDTGGNLTLFDSSCIDTAFLFFPDDDAQFLTTQEGCGSGSHSNFRGVLWVEDIVNSINSASSRSFADGTDDLIVVTDSVFPGITVPDDISSLVDAMEMENFPVHNQVRSILSWERVEI